MKPKISDMISMMFFDIDQFVYLYALEQRNILCHFEF